MHTALACAFVPFLAACASHGTPSSPWIGVSATETSAGLAAPQIVEPLAADTLALAMAPAPEASSNAAPTTHGPELGSLALETSALPRLGDDGLGDSYTQLRLGAFDPRGDVSGLDTGYWAEVAFGKRFVKLVSVEAVTGFYSITGQNGGEVYGVPLMINGRVGVPLLVVVEPYAGFGVGGLWAHSELNGFDSKDSFAALWDAFLGVEVGLGGFALGAEYKYLKTADLDGPGGLGDFQLEGHVFFLTGKLPF